MRYAIEAIAAAVCGVLDALGGFHWLFARRFIMPFLFGVTASVVSCLINNSINTWWIGFLPLPTMGTLCLGYSKDGNAGRGLWLAIQAFMLGLGLAIFNHIGLNLWFVHINVYPLDWLIYGIYIVGAGFLGGIYKNWPQTVGDFITGTYLGLLLIFVH